MKKLFVSVIAIVAISLSVSAQDSTAAKKQDSKALKAAYKAGKDHHKDKMKDLNLTVDQKKELKGNREEYKSQVQTIRNDQTLSTEQKNEKIASLKKEERSRTASVLTPEQKDKQMQDKVKHREDEKQHTEKKMSDMKTALSLSDDQVAKLKAQDMNNHAQMKAIKQDKSLDEAAKRQKLTDLKKTDEDQRKSILTADQQKKMEEMKKEHKAAKEQKKNK